MQAKKAAQAAAGRKKVRIHSSCPLSHVARIIGVPSASVRSHPPHQLEEFKKKKQARVTAASDFPAADASNGQEQSDHATPHADAAPSVPYDDVGTPGATHTATADYSTPDTTRAMWGTPAGATDTPAPTSNAVQVRCSTWSPHARLANDTT